MKEIFTYLCEDCGYELKTSPYGHYAHRIGEFYNFKCHKCRKIISMSGHNISQFGWGICCPDCGDSHLSTWNPIDGCCPRCNGVMSEK